MKIVRDPYIMWSLSLERTAELYGTIMCSEFLRRIVLYKSRVQICIYKISTAHKNLDFLTKPRPIHKP